MSSSRSRWNFSRHLDATRDVPEHWRPGTPALFGGKKGKQLLVKPKKTPLHHFVGCFFENPLHSQQLPKFKRCFIFSSALSLAHRAPSAAVPKSRALCQYERTRVARAGSCHRKASNVSSKVLHWWLSSFHLSIQKDYKRSSFIIFIYRAKCLSEPCETIYGIYLTHPNHEILLLTT